MFLLVRQCLAGKKVVCVDGIEKFGDCGEKEGCMEKTEMEAAIGALGIIHS